MRRWLWLTAVIALVLVGVSPAVAQDSDDQVCVRKGGRWDAEQGACIVGAQIEMTAPYPMELVGMPYAEQAIDGFLQNRRQQFLGALIEYGPTPSPGPLVQDMQYALFERGDAYTSVLFTVYEFTGGAHGNTTFQTFIFDHANKRVMGLYELFTDPPAALEAIAPIVRDDLRARLGEMTDEDWLNEGTAPVDANYQNAVLTPDALVFYFPPYQVAAYAAGTFDVAVPLTAIEDYLALPLE